MSVQPTALLPPAVTVHGLAHARLALAPGRPVLLLSGPGAAVYGGALWWRELIRLACEPPGAFAPDALDCADHPGRALEALATGCRIIILLPCPAFGAVQERAAGALVMPVRPPSLDLAQRGADRQLAAWLGTAGQGDSPRGIG